MIFYNTKKIWFSFSKLQKNRKFEKEKLFWPPEETFDQQLVFKVFKLNIFLIRYYYFIES